MKKRFTNKTYKEQQQQQKKKPNDPKAMAQQQVLPPSASFLKSYLLRQLTQGNLSKRSWTLPVLTPQTPGLAAEQRGHSSLAGGEMSAEGRSQEQRPQPGPGETAICTLQLSLLLLIPFPACKLLYTDLVRFHQALEEFFLG